MPPSETNPEAGPRAGFSWLSRNREGAMIWVALVVLLLLCVAFEPSTLKSSAILSMLPFASILAIAAVGQCLVIQQGGIDFSVVGSITLAAVIVTGHAAGDNGKLPEAIAMALVAVMIAGLINGIAVTQLRITPIIATLATNALLIGAVQSYTNGVPKAASDGLSEFAIDKTFGIPHTVYIAAVFVIVAAVVLSKTTLGRRFVVIGANPDAAKAVGLRVSSYVIGTYMLAALCYGAAGIVLAGYVKSPGTTAGNPYLLSTITAVVIGGTALGGGRGRIVGAGIAAVFLCQLEAFISAIGAPASVSLLVQSAAIAIAVGFSSNEVAAALRRSFTALKPGPRQRGYRRAPGGAG